MKDTPNKEHFSIKDKSTYYFVPTCLLFRGSAVANNGRSRDKGDSLMCAIMWYIKEERKLKFPCNSIKMLILPYLL